MNTIAETLKSTWSENAVERAEGLSEAVWVALQPFAAKVDSMWASVEARREVDQYDARPEIAYRQFLLNGIQPAIMRVFSTADAPLTVDNSEEEPIFTIYHKGHLTQQGPRTGIFNGPEGGDFETMMDVIEETIMDACADFKNAYR